MNMNMRNYQGPPTLYGTTLLLPSLLLRQGEKKDSLLGGHTGTATPQTPQHFSPQVANPACSKLFCLAQVAQDSNQDMKDTPREQHTPVRFPLPGKSSGPGYTEGLPTSQRATSEASAVYERTQTQQNG